MITVQAHGKVNLYLRIVGKLPNGYHEIESVMHSMELHDLVIVKAAAKEISLTCEWGDPRGQGASLAAQLGQPGQWESDVQSAIPCDSRNLAWKAAALLKDRYRVEKGATVHLKKAIPAAAGLAGGSADAAATLVALNRLWELDRPREELLRLGVELGADVPFCLVGGSKICQGIGERMSDAPTLTGGFVVLVKPQFSLSTAEVYTLADTMPDLLTEKPGLGQLVRSMDLQDFSAAGRSLFNDLQTVSLRIRPELSEWLNLVGSTACSGAMMSGSGPTVFGLYETECLAANAVESILSAPTPGPAQVILTRLWSEGAAVR